MFIASDRRKRDAVWRSGTEVGITRDVWFRSSKPRRRFLGQRAINMSLLRSKDLIASHPAAARSDLLQCL